MGSSSRGKSGGLNTAQKAAVEHIDGPALVVAGAGTGKTRVITQRIAHLVSTGAAEPHQILALTFTEKAAREMAERLHDKIGWKSYQVAVQTFNAFGSELLGRFASHIGRSVRGGLLNDTQKALLLQQGIDRVELSYYGPHSNIFEFLMGVIEYIGRLQNAGITSDNYAKYVENISTSSSDMHPQDQLEQQDLSKLYNLYEEIKKETDTYDYSDQIVLPLKILHQKPNIAERLQKQYKYVLIDEYQDTNKVQDDLIGEFINSDGNLFVVGDDDQAIYGFRGANLGNILHFADRYKVKQPVVLTQNYRSGQEILDAAYKMINHNNPHRLEASLGLDKKLKAEFDGSKIEFKPYQSAADELMGVVEAIESRIASGEAPSEIAVLSATHAPLKQLAKIMRQREVPFAISSQVNIFEQSELKQLWYLLEWISGRADDRSLAQVLLSRFFGLTAEQVRKLSKRSVVEPQSDGLEDELRKQSDHDQTYKRVVDQLDEWRKLATDLPVSHLCYQIVFKSGVSDQLIEEAKQQFRIIRVFEDLSQLLRQMQDYETVSIDETLMGYLAAFPSPPAIEVQEPVGESAGVQLLTVHASKGLEFNSVYLIGCTHRNWSRGPEGGWKIPDELQDNEGLGQEHELRRLMYVAVTRARRFIQLSAAALTTGGSRQSITPFVDELLGARAKQGTESDIKPDRLDTTLTKIQRLYPLSSQITGRTLPFEDSDGWLNLNVSDLASYDFCPYDFYLEKVLQIHQPFGPQLAFGNAVHGAIQSFYDARLRGEDLTATAMEERLQELWSDRGYASKKIADQAKKLAVQALHKFVAREKDSEKKIGGSEVPIKLEIPEAKLRIRGRIDAYFETEGGIELRDFKTGRKTDAESLSRRAKQSIQLRTYALAFQESTGQLPTQVVLDYVVSGTEGRAELTPKVIENHRRKLIDIANKIRSRDFRPKPSNVHECAAIKYFGSLDEDETWGEPDA